MPLFSSHRSVKVIKNQAKTELILKKTFAHTILFCGQNIQHINLLCYTVQILGKSQVNEPFQLM